MSDFATTGSQSETSQDSADAAWAIRRAGELLAEGDTWSACELLGEALDASARSVDVLWALVDAEFADEDPVAGREHLDEAIAASPADAASEVRKIRALCRGGFWREALAAVQAVPEDLRADPRVRTEVGNFYRVCLCPAHAVGAYGPHRGIPEVSWRAYRWCWLRSGGPSRRVRQTVTAWEDKCLAELWHPPAHIASISGLDALEHSQVKRVRAQLETFWYENNRRWHSWLALHRAGYRLIPFAVVPIWLVLVVVVSLAGFTPGRVGTWGFAAISAVVAVAPVIATVRAILRPNGRYRFQPSPSAVVALLLVVVAAEVVVGEGYARHLLPFGDWQAAVILGLAIVPATLACLPVAWTVAFMPQIMWSRRKVRQDALLLAIDSLLIVLHDLRSPRGSRGIGQRLFQSRELEYAARRLTRDLFPPPAVRYLGSGAWLTRRAAGWAEALRYAQRQLVASVPGGLGEVESTLVHEIQCLVTGDLGALAWREPPPLPPRKVTVRRKVISAARAIVVAVLPFVAVLAAQPLVHVSYSLFSWARITTAIWALLYVLLSIDPTMRDKIGTARDLANLMQTAPLQRAIRPSTSHKTHQ